MLSNEKYTKTTGLLLAILLVIAVASYFVVPKFNLFTQSKKTDQTTAQSVNSSVAQVKAVTTTTGTTSTDSGICVPGEVCSYLSEIQYQPLCMENNAPVDLTDGTAFQGKSSVKVNKNAVVEPFEITVPQVLLQGSKYVDDSRMTISKKFPVYRDSRSIILSDEARRLCAPGVNCKELSIDTGDEPFGVDAITEVHSADSGGDNGRGKAVIASDSVLNSACPKVQNSKANPAKSASLSKQLDMMQQPPGEHDLNKNLGNTKCYNSNPNGVFINEFENFKSCVTDVKLTDFVASAVFKIDQWLKCLAGDAECQDTEIFAIRLDALYGGSTKCTAPDCEIRYFDYQKLQTVAPGEAMTMIPSEVDASKVDYLHPVTKPYYITTPCKIRINKSKIADVPCLWDISPYQRQYEVQRANSMPNDPTLPSSFEDYWLNYVTPELKKRAVSCM